MLRLAPGVIASSQPSEIDRPMTCSVFWTRETANRRAMHSSVTFVHCLMLGARSLHAQDRWGKASHKMAEM
jgi:hypothetical protein